jgi:hypothetical protein
MKEADCIISLSFLQVQLVTRYSSENERQDVHNPHKKVHHQQAAAAQAVCE